MKTKHPEQFGDNNLSFPCSFCHKIFDSKSEVQQHSKTCSAKTFNCSHCSKKFALERQLKIHMNWVNGIKKHQCAICERNFSTRNELTVHTRTHTKERPYVCTFLDCGKTFRTNSNRSCHMDIHNDKKTFQCSNCNEMFQTRGLRRLHERSHKSVNRCAACLKIFRQRSHYVRHVNKVHSVQCTSTNLEEKIQNLISKNVDDQDFDRSDDSN